METQFQRTWWILWLTLCFSEVQHASSEHILDITELSQLKAIFALIALIITEAAQTFDGVEIYQSIARVVKKAHTIAHPTRTRLCLLHAVPNLDRNHNRQWHLKVKPNIHNSRLPSSVDGRTQCACHNMSSIKATTP